MTTYVFSRGKRSNNRYSLKVRILVGTVILAVTVTAVMFVGQVVRVQQTPRCISRHACTCRFVPEFKPCPEWRNAHD
jgi:hypothetical protein